MSTRCPISQKVIVQSSSLIEHVSHLFAPTLATAAVITITTSFKSTVTLCSENENMGYRYLPSTIRYQAIYRFNPATLEFKWNSFIFCSAFVHGERAKGHDINCSGNKKVECHDIILPYIYCMAGASNLKVTALQLRSTWWLLDWNFKCSRAQATDRYFDLIVTAAIEYEYIQIAYFSWNLPDSHFKNGVFSALLLIKFMNIYQQKFHQYWHMISATLIQSCVFLSCDFQPNQSHIAGDK